MHNKPSPPPPASSSVALRLQTQATVDMEINLLSTSTTYNKFRDRTPHCTARSTRQVRSRSPDDFGGRINPRALRPTGPCSGGIVFLDKYACGSRIMFRDRRLLGGGSDASWGGIALRERERCDDIFVGQLAGVIKMSKSVSTHEHNI